MTKGYEERKEANKRYLEKLDEIKVRVPKGRKAAIEAYVVEAGYYSVNGYISDLIRVDIGLTEEEWRRKDETD